jgi:hypothetical protein
MGTLRELDGTWAGLHIPTGAKLIALISNPMIWDECMMGTNLELLNNGKTAIKHTEEDYEAVMCANPMASGRHHWEVRIDSV